jgi:hypothetical protein
MDDRTINALLDLSGAARGLELLAVAAPQHWPPAARSMCGLAIGLVANVEEIRKVIVRQDEELAHLRADVERLESELAILRGALSAERHN